MPECRSCGRRIVFVKTKKGRTMPVDASTATPGDQVFDPDRHRSHFATCGAADRHRKPRRPTTRPVVREWWQD